MRTIRFFPCLFKALEYAAAADGRKVRDNLKELPVPGDRYFEFEDAEQCAQELDGHAISAFLDADSLEKDTNIEHDALECVATTTNNDAERIVHQFGEAGDALESILEDALSGSLQDYVFGEG